MRIEFAFQPSSEPEPPFQGVVCNYPVESVKVIAFVPGDHDYPEWHKGLNLRLNFKGDNPWSDLGISDKKPYARVFLCRGEDGSRIPINITEGIEADKKTGISCLYGYIPPSIFERE